jgi:outer membrane cobalamin receptor
VEQARKRTATAVWTRGLCALVLAALFAPVNVSAAEPGTDTTAGAASQVVDYPAAFFERYKPNTALDMVRQLPGFKLDDGDGTRGFASSAGNLLINGQRPSAKQDLPSATLARIPASQVEHIELIRGQMQGVDLQGQSVLANVYLRTDIPATVRWQLWAEHNKAAPFKPGGSISLSDRIGEIDFNTGIDLERDTSGWTGTESRYDGNDMLLESGPTDRVEKGFRINSLNLNAARWFGDNHVNFNTRLTANKTDYLQPNQSISPLPGNRTRDVIIRSTNKNMEYEFSGDIERHLLDELTGKLILLYNNKDQRSDSSQENLDTLLGRTLLRLADTETARKEVIARTEFDWSRFDDHALQFNLERAYNVLDRGLVQTDDRGSGAVFVAVPGANSRVSEVRWDLLVQDTWTRASLVLDLGLGAEASTLAQTGDAELERDFSYLKPLAALSYAFGDGNQSRIKLVREVSQLDLTDFVSATVFEDDDLALGNPNIRPQTTWVSEFSQEKRFGKERVIKLTAFHHWIRDVLDLLPLSSTFEAPGNIGDGRRWGVELESSFPLEWLGLHGAKMDLRASWQDSVVTDPVTGLDRRLSNDGGGTGYRTLENLNGNIHYHLRADYRQDFEQARIAWGWTVADRSSRTLFKVNELDMYSEGTAFNTFIETTRWFGIKIRLEAANMLSYDQHRERTLYTGERGLTPVGSRIVRDRRHDISRVGLFLDGNF